MAIVINGSGTVTGLAVGGLPDGTVDDGTLASNAVTEAKIATDAVTAAKIATNSVDSAELVDGAVDNSHLADDAVGTDELANDVEISTSGDISSTGAIGITVDGFATTAAANGWTQPLQIKYTETSISSTGWHHIDLNRQDSNGAGSIGCGVPIGFIPGKEYNANMNVEKIGCTPWPDGTNRYEYKVYVNVTTAGTLGIFYLFGG